ncbi:HIT domain-containing protein [Candidatus Parcubacteria bacterium]|nr:HIT domain-containing protein [Patescibacteria group bacterium]MCG2689223.1 HIT domain-containing protein [Candidatus Parcubacteria bacterium]
MDYSNYNARTYQEYSKIWTATGKCVFCDLKEKYIAAEKNGIVLTVNIFPYIDGHLLIIPRRHIEDFDDCSDKEWKTIKELSKLGKKLLKRSLGVKDVWFIYRIAKGFGAQKTVAHAHAHLIPYSEKLFKWEFQKIGIAPESLASKLRKFVG